MIAKGSTGGVAAVLVCRLAFAQSLPSDRAGNHDPRACPCAALACAVVLEQLKLPPAEEQIGALKAPPAAPRTLEELAAALRRLGLRADVRRLTPSELKAATGPVIVQIGGGSSETHTHFETKMASNDAQLYMAAPAYFAQGHLVVRNWNGLSDGWDGQAIIAQTPEAGGTWRGVGAMLGVIVCGLLIGWALSGWLLRWRNAMSARRAR